MNMKVFVDYTLSLLATWFYIGKIKKAPGTWATLAALPLALVLNLLGPLFYMTSVFLLLLIGIVAADFYEKKSSIHDNSEIVIDEVLGYLITMIWLPSTWQAYVIGFILFRILDIFKPFPIGYLDRKIKGGMGVMMDDIAAGIIANIILQQAYTYTAILGSQLIHVAS